MSGPADLGAQLLTRALARRRRPFVLCYHGVGRPARDEDPHGLFVSREAFVGHLDLIAGQGYELIGVHDLWVHDLADY